MSYVFQRQTLSLLFLLCLGLPTLFGAGGSAPKGVRVGDWTVEGSGSLYVRQEGKDTTFGWYGAAARAKDRAGIDIITASVAGWVNDMNETLELPGLGPVRFRVGTLEALQQQDSHSLRQTSVALSLAWRAPLQWVVVEAHRPMTDFLSLSEKSQTLSSEEEQRLIQSAIETTRKNLMTASAADLLRSLVLENPLLDRQRISGPTVEVQAAVNGGDFQALKRSDNFKSPFNSTAWHLPVKPGDRVAVRIRAPLNEYLIRPKSIERVDPPETAITGEMDVDGTSGKLLDRDRVEIDLGVLQSARMLRLNIRDWGQSGFKMSQDLPLRWGRPEEAWLDSGMFPLADKLENPTLQNAVSAILSDLNSAYDSDRDIWFWRRGNSEIYPSSWAIYAALRGVDEHAYPHLAALGQNQFSQNPIHPELTIEPANWGREMFGSYTWPARIKTETVQLDPQDVRVLLKQLSSKQQQPVLSQAFPHYRPTDPISWHSPKTAYGLAVLWQASFRAEDGNPLREMLDYWVSAMPQNLDPVHEYGKAAVEPDTELEARSYAIAALHVGFEVFQKPEYRQMRDLQMRRMVAVLETNGAMKLIREKSSWFNVDYAIVKALGTRDFSHVVSIYGQTCAFIGDKEGLEQAQAWILAALARKSRAYDAYMQTTFLDRCGLLAVMQGRAAFLAAPEVAK